MKAIKKLTLMYFIDQKIKEIVGGGLFLSVILLILYTLGKLDYLSLCEECSSLWITLILVGLTNLLLILLILLIVVVFLLLVYYILCESYKLLLEPWIKSNWENAKEKARKELK